MDKVKIFKALITDLIVLAEVTHTPFDGLKVFAYY